MRRRRGWGQHLPQHERHHADARVDSASATPRIRRTPGGGSSGASCDAPFGIDAQIDANAILHYTYVGSPLRFRIFVNASHFDESQRRLFFTHADSERRTRTIWFSRAFPGGRATPPPTALGRKRGGGL